MRISRLVVCGLSLAALTAYGPLAASTAAPVALQDDVKQVYTAKCAVCHGEDGAGKTAKGKKLKMKDVRSADVQKLTPAQWTDAIIKGSGEDMDAFGKELGADMAKKLAAYMRDLSTKK